MFFFQLTVLHSYILQCILVFCGLRLNVFIHFQCFFFQSIFVSAKNFPSFQHCSAFSKCRFWVQNRRRLSRELFLARLRDELKKFSFLKPKIFHLSFFEWTFKYSKAVRLCQECRGLYFRKSFFPFLSTTLSQFFKNCVLLYFKEFFFLVLVHKLHVIILMFVTFQLLVFISM